jgi:head-tail adaptor
MIQDLPDRLTERIRIESPTAISDTQGGRNVTWQLFTECFAEVRIDGQFRASRTAHMDITNLRYRITIYPNAAITQAMRVVWKTKYLTLHHSEIYPTHMVLVCEEEIRV